MATDEQVVQYLVAVDLPASSARSHGSSRVAEHLREP